MIFWKRKRERDKDRENPVSYKYGRHEQKQRIEQTEKQTDIERMAKFYGSPPINFLILEYQEGIYRTIRW